MEDVGNISCLENMLNYLIEMPANMYPDPGS